MKKICFITTVPITLETFVYPIALRLAETGKIQVTVISSFDDESMKHIPSIVNFYNVKMKRGVNFHFFSSIIKLYRIFRKEKFEMIQYSTPNAALYSSIAGKFSKIKIRLYAQWGIRYVSFEGVTRYIFRKIEMITCRFSTVIRAVSELNKQFGLSERLYSADVVKVVGKGGTIGVDLKVFSLEKKQDSINEVNKIYNLENYYVYGFVGRLTTDKGAKELLMSFCKLSKKHEVKLLVIGPNEFLNDNEIMNIIDTQCMKNIIFTGYIPHDLLYKYYSRFDCFVHPSHREGFGMVLQEAGAMCLPIITTNIPGASEVFINQESCHLVPPNNPSKLHEAMELLLLDRDYSEKISRNAYLRTSELFERGKMINQLIDDYFSLLGL